MFVAGGGILIVALGFAGVSHVDNAEEVDGPAGDAGADDRTREDGPIVRAARYEDAMPLFPGPQLDVAEDGDEADRNAAE